MKNLEIVKNFSEAVKAKNIEAVSELLSDTGEFHMQDKQLNTIETDKAGFLSWLIQRLSNAEILSIACNQCLHCRIGNPVVLFNDGQFPRLPQDSSERSKTGLMLEIQNGKIQEIAFCYTFVEGENKYLFEINTEKIKKLVARGFTFDEAYKVIVDAPKN